MTIETTPSVVLLRCKERRDRERAAFLIDRADRYAEQAAKLETSTTLLPKDWDELADLDLCEGDHGHGAADRWDVDGVPLCRDCYDSLEGTP